jgi:hypothetical protein
VESRRRRPIPAHGFSRRGRRACPLTRAVALSTYQRLATYMVISMPNRNSTACGVSHFIANPLEQVRPHLAATPLRQRSTHS